MRAQYRVPRLGAVTAAFKAVYDRYPNKDGKNPAGDAFQVIADNYPGGEGALRDAILAWFDTGVLKRHPYNADEHRFRPKLETVIGERRWEDDQSAPDESTSDTVFNPYSKLKDLPAGVLPPPRPRP